MDERPGNPRRACPEPACCNIARADFAVFAVFADLRGGKSLHFRARENKRPQNPQNPQNL
ncbi:MAG: hypothetical protein ACE5HB_10005 [Terriglobia bacterium]